MGDPRILLLGSQSILYDENDTTLDRIDNDA